MDVLSAPALPFASPADVPAHVDDALLTASLRAAWPAGVREITLQTSGLSFPLLTQGSGSVDVLCVHGLGHDCADFAPLFARRPDGTRLHAIDLPGFGLAAKGPAPVDLPLLADALDAAIAHIARPLVLVASSLGGHIALLSLLRAGAVGVSQRNIAREAVRGLVLAAPGGLATATAGQAALARAYYGEDAINARSEDEILRNSHRIFVRGAEDAASRRIAARKLAIHRSSSRRAFARPFARVVDSVFDHPLADRFPTLDLPTLIIRGSHDVVVERGPLVAAAARAPRCEYVELPSVGHLPMVEDADRFARLTFDFVDAHCAPLAAREAREETSP